MGGLFSWLLDNGFDANSGTAETFHFQWWWLGFCVGTILIYLYYQAEGRKRFVKGRTLPIHKYLLDRFLNQVALLAFVGLFVLAGRALFVNTFFAYRLWRYGWLAWAAALGIYWIVYFVRHYSDERDAWLAYRRNARYIPQARSKRKPATRAN